MHQLFVLLLANPKSPLKICTVNEKNNHVLWICTFMGQTQCKFSTRKRAFFSEMTDKDYIPAQRVQITLV